MKIEKFKQLFAKKETATDVTTIDISEEVATDDRQHTRFGWWIVLAGVGGFLLWACLAPLDQGSPMQGTVMVSSNRKSIQHQTGGTVREILVKEGDKVSAGQVLVRMDETQAKSQAEITRVQYYAARAAEARLLAERDGKAKIAFPEALTSSEDPRAREAITVQTQLFNARQMAIKNELGSYSENIAGLKAQASFLKEQLDGMRQLAKEGYIPRNRQLELERTYAQISSSAAEITLRRIQRQQEYQKEVRTQLSDMQKEAEALENRLKSNDYDLANTLVRSPVDGTVVDMAIFTSGGVVAPGFKMMDVVPSEDTLIVEGQLPVHLVDKVYPDLPVEMNFSAFNQRTTPHIPGTVISVSADRLTDQRTGMPYYKVRAQATPEGMKQLAHHDIRPGMPVDLFVKTGERTMMNYLMKPVFDRANASLKEE
ncbi:MAG: HlyD family type I secretion periplasmic adaptor subunit [Burkholderiaceae bacterium]|nr:HlyD family type I secretion periplasmic adaptor subunit [Burkholderiaceae bacterium]